MIFNLLIVGLPSCPNAYGRSRPILKGTTVKLQSRFGLSFQVPATIAHVVRPLMTAASGTASASAAVAAHPIDEKASAKVVSREEVWRRRNALRLACTRNQSWIAVDDAAPSRMPDVV